jgi:hypothetical protein
MPRIHPPDIYFCKCSTMLYVVIIQSVTFSPKVCVFFWTKYLAISRKLRDFFPISIVCRIHNIIKCRYIPVDLLGYTVFRRTDLSKISCRGFYLCALNHYYTSLAYKKLLRRGSLSLGHPHPVKILLPQPFKIQIFAVIIFKF